MKSHIITTGTITYAIKGRDILRRLGYKARIERKASSSGYAGCGYTIITSGDIGSILRTLETAGVKVLDSREYDE